MGGYDGVMVAVAHRGVADVQFPQVENLVVFDLKGINRLGKGGQRL